MPFPLACFFFCFLLCFSRSSSARVPPVLDLYVAPPDGEELTDSVESWPDSASCVSPSMPCPLNYALDTFLPTQNLSFYGKVNFYLNDGLYNLASFFWPLEVATTFVTSFDSTFVTFVEEYPEGLPPLPSNASIFHCRRSADSLCNLHLDRIHLRGLKRTLIGDNDTVYGRIGNVEMTNAVARGLISPILKSANAGSQWIRFRNVSIVQSTLVNATGVVDVVVKDLPPTFIDEVRNCFFSLSLENVTMNQVTLVPPPVYQPRTAFILVYLPINGPIESCDRAVSAFIEVVDCSFTYLGQQEESIQSPCESPFFLSVDGGRDLRANFSDTSIESVNAVPIVWLSPEFTYSNQPFGKLDINMRNMIIQSNSRCDTAENGLFEFWTPNKLRLNIENSVFSNNFLSLFFLVVVEYEIMSSDCNYTQNHGLLMNFQLSDFEVPSNCSLSSLNDRILLHNVDDRLHNDQEGMSNSEPSSIHDIGAFGVFGFGPHALHYHVSIAVIIRSMVAESNAGGVFQFGNDVPSYLRIFDSLSLIIEGGVFRENEPCYFLHPACSYGGSVFNSAGNGGVMNVQMVDTLFESNHAYLDYSNGSVIFLQTSDPTALYLLRLRNCSFRHNQANAFGGAVYVSTSLVPFEDQACTTNAIQVFAEGCDFRHNFACMDGGAFYASGCTAISFTDVFWDSNLAGHEGGAVYAATSSVAFANVTLRSNAAAVGGGALAFNSVQALQMDHASVVGPGNQAKYGGGIVWVDQKNKMMLMQLDAEITENVASVSWGGVYWMVADPAIQLRRCHDNSAENGMNELTFPVSVDYGSDLSNSSCREGEDPNSLLYECVLNSVQFLDKWSTVVTTPVCDEGYAVLSLLGRNYSFSFVETKSLKIQFSSLKRIYGTQSARIHFGFEMVEFPLLFPPEQTCFGIKLSSPNVCSAHGRCVGFDVCVCNGKYYGIDCRQWDCGGRSSKDSYSCSQHGLCSSPDWCDCFTGFTGPSCNQWIADEPRLSVSCLASSTAESSLTTFATIEGLSHPLFWSLQFDYSDGSRHRNQINGDLSDSHTFTDAPHNSSPSVVVTVWSSLTSDTPLFVVVGNFSCYGECEDSELCAAGDSTDRCCSGSCCQDSELPNAHCSACSSVGSNSVPLCCPTKNLSCVSLSPLQQICCDSVSNVCTDLVPNYCCSDFEGKERTVVVGIAAIQIKSASLGRRRVVVMKL